jgi:hypothetical protein
MTPYNEDTLAQQTTADFFEQELGWESIYAFHEPSAQMVCWAAMTEKR